MRRELRAVHEELRGTTILATRDPLDAIRRLTGSS
jgi:hypothetical protein